jgi:SHS2 domain-containing protein
VGHRWGEHVGELELHLDGADEAAVFASAVAALGELLAADEAGRADEWFDVSAEGDDRAVLLAAWLDELVFLAEHERVVPVDVAELALARTSIRARVGGHRADPPHLVKAVTYHRLAFEPGDRGYRATVVLDV